MSVASKIKGALDTRFGADKVVDSVYNGTTTPYVVFNIADSRGQVFADNKPKIDTTTMQIHYFCDLTYNYYSDKAFIRKALFDTGFTYPQITQLIEEETKKRHLIFECEIFENSET